MELKCLQCEYEFEGTVSKDDLGWRSSCPNCGGSFDVEVPTGTLPNAVLSEAEMPFEESQKAAKAYERFRLQWMIDHGFTLPDLLNELEKMIDEDMDGSIVRTSLGNLFEDWEFGFGFANGEVWPSFDEFLCSEYPLILQGEGKEVQE